MRSQVCSPKFSSQYLDVLSCFNKIDITHIAPGIAAPNSPTAWQVFPRQRFFNDPRLKVEPKNERKTLDTVSFFE